MDTTELGASKLETGKSKDARAPRPDELRRTKYKEDKSWSTEVYSALQAPRGSVWAQLHAEAHSTKSRKTALQHACAPRTAPSSLSGVFRDAFTDSSTNITLNEDCWAGKLRRELRRPVKSDGSETPVRRSNSAAALKRDGSQSALTRGLSVCSLGTDTPPEMLEAVQSWTYLWETDQYSQLYHPRLNCAVTPVCRQSDDSELFLIPCLHPFVMSELRLTSKEVSLELGADADRTVPSNRYVKAKLVHFSKEMLKELTAFKRATKVFQSQQNRKAPQMYSSCLAWPCPSAVRELLASSEAAWASERAIGILTSEKAGIRSPRVFGGG